MRLCPAALALAVLVAGCAHAAPGPIQLSGSAQQGGVLLGTVPPGTVRLTLDGRPVRLTGEGRFIIGFGRDAVPLARVVATLADGQTTARVIAVAQRTYEIESIPSLRVRPATPDGAPDAEAEAAYALRRTAEVAAIAAARAGDSGETGWMQAFIWPALGRISGVYGSQRILGGVPANPHFGTDIAAPAGTPVIAPAAGMMRLAQGPFALEGNLIVLDHGHGLSSTFIHLSRIDVTPGTRVAQGQLIGAIGTTGRSTGPHLHWAMTWDNVRVDAATLVVAPMPDTAAGAQPSRLALTERPPSTLSR